MWRIKIITQKNKNPINQKREEIQKWFDNCDPKTTQTRDALKRAAKLIWDYQTIEEKENGNTIDHNGVGYGAFDAKFAQRIVYWNGMFTEKLAFAARKMLKKYARQLAEITLRKNNRDPIVR